MSSRSEPCSWEAEAALGTSEARLIFREAMSFTTSFAEALLVELLGGARDFVFFGFDRLFRSTAGVEGVAEFIDAHRASVELIGR
jgi:hypothetical protein